MITEQMALDELDIYKVSVETKNLQKLKGFYTRLGNLTGELTRTANVI